MVWDDWGVAKAYRAVVRDQPLLLPVDMREWLPRDHQVWLLIEVVEQHLDTSAFHRGRRLGGAGRAGYDPDMLLTVLIWAYAQGERSSRRIERACQQDLAYRVICGGNLPDHTTIARFRAEFAEAVTELFAQVLQLCARLGMVNLATITLDGTKVRGNASMGANRGLDWLEHHAAAAVAEHAAADASEDDLFGPGRRGDAVPTDLQPDPTDTDPTDPTDTSGGCGGGDGGGGGGALTPARARGQAGRAARIREALEQVGTAVQERTQAQQATADAYLERVRAGQKAPGRIPAGLELAAAQTRLDRILAEQEAKLAAWHDWSPYRTHRLRGHRPKVDDYFQVVQLRAQIERLQARQPTPNTSTSTSTSGQGGDGQGGDGQGGDGQGGDGEKTSADKADRRGPVRNITDTASRVMPTRNGFIQGYNAQNVITADGLILATRLTQCPNDVTFYQPMINEAVATAARLATHRPTTGTGTGTGTDPTQIGLVLADAGYLSTDNLTTPGPDRLIATGKHRTLLHAARDHTPPAQTDPDPTDPHPDSQTDPADPITAMTQRLRTPEGITAYNQRSHLAETPHGHLKHNMRFSQLCLRGLPRANAEWTFATATANLFKALPHAARHLPATP